MSVQIKYEVSLYKLGFAPSNNFLFDGGIYWGATGVGSTRFLGHWLYDFRPQQDFGIDKVVILPLNESNAYENIAYCDYMRIHPQKAGEQNAFSEWDYFITKIERIANESIRLTMKMDTLNTFREIVLNHLTAKTMIKREHKDRFLKKTNLSFPITNVRFPRKIDRVSESFKPVLRHTDRPNPISEVNWGINQNWYLIYKTKEDLSESDLSNPVACYVTSDLPVQYQDAWSGEVITYNVGNVTANFYYYAIYPDNIGGKFTLSGTSSVTNIYNGTYEIGSKVTDTLNYFYNKYIMGAKFYKAANSSGQTVFQVVMIVTDSLSNSNYEFVNVTESAIAASLKMDAIKIVRNSSIDSNQFSVIQTMAVIDYNSGYSSAVKNTTIDGIDRTDSKLIKIIKLPYCPVTPIKTGNNFNLGSDFTFIGGLFKLNENAIGKEFINGSITPFNAIGLLSDVLSISDLKTALTTNRYITDSKLYHSDFFILKFLYDSFSIDYKLEHLCLQDPDSDEEEYSFSISFKATNTINSNFLFEITNMAGDSYNAEEDFYTCLLSSRNNEVTIFTNAYINYIKTGFNYDKKSKALSAAADWTGAVISIVGGIVGAGAGAMTGNPISAAAGVGLITNGISQISNAINSQISSDNTLESKLATLKAQSTSVAGSDDVDLLTYYSKNKLCYCEYQPTFEVTKMLSDLFYYFGYACNYQAIPDFTSRTWFNFVQCEPVFDIATTSTILPVYLDDLSARLKEGVTCLHYRDAQRTGTASDYFANYDFNQVRENYERWILGL